MGSVRVWRVRHNTIARQSINDHDLTCTQAVFPNMKVAVQNSSRLMLVSGLSVRALYETPSVEKFERICLDSRTRTKQARRARAYGVQPWAAHPELDGCSNPASQGGRFSVHHVEYFLKPQRPNKHVIGLTMLGCPKSKKQRATLGCEMEPYKTTTSCTGLRSNSHLYMLAFTYTISYFSLWLFIEVLI